MIDFLIINPSVELTDTDETSWGSSERREYFKKLNVTDVHYILPHIGVGYLLSVSKQNGISAKYLDMIAEDLLVSDIIEYVKIHKPRLVGFTGWTPLIHNSAKIAEFIKNISPNTLICTGGPHGTAIPFDTLKEFPVFDFIVIGEAETTIINLFKNDLKYDTIENIVSKTKKIYTLPEWENLDNLPYPAWEDFQLKNYNGFDTGMGIQEGRRLELPVITSRGCNGACTFCWRQFGIHRRHRSVMSVIDEIERNIIDFGCQSIHFFDETFIFNETYDWSVELFETMIKRGINKKIRWAGATRIDIKSTDIFKLAKESGCYFMFFGVESANTEVRRRTGKTFSNQQIYDTINAANSSGINCAAAFIFGLPGDSESTLKENIDMAESLGIYSTTFPIAVPFPGTAIRKFAENNKYGLKILTNDWSLYDKQYPGVMDSVDLNIDVLRKYQSEGYSRIPQKQMKL